MAVMLAPYTNAMRLGQGFNSYTQQICVDDAVVVDPSRAENVITNDGTTMRIVAESSGRPSAWNRIKEVVNEGPVHPNVELLLPPPPVPAGGDDENEGAQKEAALVKATELKALKSAANNDKDASAAKALTDSKAEEAAASTESETAEPSAEEEEEEEEEEDEEEKEPEPEQDTPSSSPKEGGDVSEGESAVHVDEDDIPAPAATPVADHDKAKDTQVESKTVKMSKRAENTTSRPRSSSVGGKQAKDAVKSTTKASKYQVKDIPMRTRKAPTAIDADIAQLEKEEKMQMIKEEKARMAEQRAYRSKLDLEAREDERRRQAEDRAEQRQIRREKRAYDKARREAAQKAITEAVAAKKDALTLADLDKIKAQNQFADRFDGIDASTEQYLFDASGPRGPSQTVTYSSRFIDRLSDVTDDMAISGALSVKMAKIGGSGRGSFVDSDKFKESDLNFYISVKVVNQTVNFKDALVFNPLRSVAIGSDDFNRVYGDSFISGFQEGGEFNAIISMKVHNKAKLLDIQAEAKVALTAGPVDITAEANVGIARTNLEMNTETTIQVSWCGGGHIKPMEQPWNIQSVMQAAARFPSLVSACPQRTHAILTKYESLRSFVARKPAAYSPIQYENAQIYTNVLMDAFMSYKSLYKKLGDDVYRIQNKTLEIDVAASAEVEGMAADSSSSSSALDTAKNTKAITAIGQAMDSGDAARIAQAKQRAAALAAAVDTKRFEASLRGLSEARRFIRRQMVYIVNEVDLIEQDPKLATDEDHDEPFQAPLMFETRLPVTNVPNALKPNSDPLSGRRIMAKTQTEDDLKKEQEERERREGDSPPLFSAEQDLTSDEQTAMKAVAEKKPQIGKHLQVSSAFPKSEAGEWFNNLDFLFPEWQVNAITIGITARGSVGAVEVVYENGLLLRKGLPADQITHRKTLDNFQGEERITSAAIETGTPVGKKAEQVLSVCMYTNRGRRLLGQAAKNEVLSSTRVRKDGTEYEQVHTLFCDSAYSKGTFKGFFGRLLLDDKTPVAAGVLGDNGGAGIRRLGIIWGDSVESKLSTTVADAAPVYDMDASTADANAAAARQERDQARNEASAARSEAAQQVSEAQATAQQQLEAAKQQFEQEKAAAVAQAKQIRFGGNVYTGRQSVSFKTFRVNPQDDAFLTFENGRHFHYQPDGNICVYDRDNRCLWASGRTVPSHTAGELIFHSDNDGNLVAWKGNGGIWATETKDCANGTLVFSSEEPFLEIFNRDGQRRCNYP